VKVAGPADQLVPSIEQATIWNNMRLGLRLAISVSLALVLCAQAYAQVPVVVTDHGPNTPAQQAQPYVILVSLDGFRTDYAQRYGATHLQAIAARGATAPRGMIPVYPTLTFPSHYSMVTGMYPENHGIVANSFYDPQRRQRFVYTDRSTSADGSWYGGAPLWVLAERQGMRAACFFWPGAEAEIGGIRPTYNVLYDPRIPNEARVDQVVAWLRLPPERRPHFITLYFGDADRAGHETGVSSPETAQAVRRIDGVIARLVAAISLLGLPVNLFVVSDHGMINVDSPWIDLERYANFSGFETVGSLLYAPNEAAAARVYGRLRGASDRFTVYRRSQLPAHLHFSRNARAGDPVVVPTGPYLIRARRSGNANETPPQGMHGYDPRTMPEMNAVFYAAGPHIRPGATVAPFENVHLYPLIARILGLQAGPIDGHINVLQHLLRDAEPPTTQNRPR
jgi:alkaline phosphatase D